MEEGCSSRGNNKGEESDDNSRERSSSSSNSNSNSNNNKGSGKRKGLVVIMVGPPGSGKSTFCLHVVSSSSYFTTLPWHRVCQDVIANGKGGTKAQCLTSAVGALKDGKNVFIDRCNLKKEQRADFVKLVSPQVDIHAVVLDLPTKLCISRCVKRTDHEGKLQGGTGAMVINKMLQSKELPQLEEGFSRITYCQNENDVEAAISMYAKLGPQDTLSSGIFGQKKPETKAQHGIMKFFKKIDTTFDTKSEAQSTEGNNHIHIPTLAFASISTADFQFDLEKASGIIVEKVEEFLPNIENARLVLVDLSYESKILSLVRAKAGQRNINTDRFFTFAGDITQLSSRGGLRCNVIANAANWRLKPGGGGVNAAIFNAAGSALDTATKELAGSISPGKALVVPLPSTSPLFIKEGVTHVIHVLGPNMNPKRPNFLNNDYIKGCTILKDAYSSLFGGFLSILNMTKTHVSETSNKLKRESDYEVDKSKRPKGFEENLEVKSAESVAKSWGSWAQALYRIARNPENYKNEVKEITDEIVVLNDMYPKAKKHFLVVARLEGLDRLADVRKEHLQLLRTMHAVGVRWAEKCINEDETLIFRVGYHSVPSMRQLHLHVTSQDFDSNLLKNKKHWNSFNTPFFRDSVDVIKEVDTHGQATLKKDNEEEKILSMELRCQRCRSAHPNIPRLKSHISKCQAPFPSPLLQNGCLVMKK